MDVRSVSICIKRRCLAAAITTAIDRHLIAAIIKCTIFGRHIDIIQSHLTLSVVGYH